MAFFEKLLPSSTSKLFYFVTLMIIGLIIIWNFVAAWWVNLDYSDGYASISNAQYFLGQIDSYFAQRAPFYAFFLIPAEIIANLLSLEAFDVRVHHLWMAVLHSFYIISCFYLLQKYSNDDLSAKVIGFFIVLPNVVFFSYAPLISHDIFAGVILLYMLFLTERFFQQKTIDMSLLSALMILGTIAAIIKVTFCLIWILIVISQVILLVNRDRQSFQSDFIQQFLAFFTAACVSAIISWLLYAWSLQTWGHVSFLLRPYAHAVAIIEHFADHQTPPMYMYIPNLALGYGFTTFFLIVPGIWLALKSKNPTKKSAAIIWVVGFFIMSMLTYKEVRYLAYLTPMAAFLIIPVIAKMLKWRLGQLIMIVLAVIDLSRAGMAAAHHFQPFYADSAVTKFLSPINELEASQKIILTHVLSFRAPQPSPFVGDVYHRIFHVTEDIIQRLYNFPTGKVILLPSINHMPPVALTKLPQFGEGSLLLFANLHVLNATRPELDQESDNRAFIQFSARISKIKYEKHENIYQAINSKNSYFFSLTAGKSINLSPIPHSISVNESKLPDDFHHTLELWGLKMIQFCNMKGCKTL